MRRSRRSVNASKAAFALAAKLSAEQRRLRAQLAALARYDRPSFDRLKFHQAERKQASEKEKRARAIVEWVLENDYQSFTYEADWALTFALREGAVPSIGNGDGRLAAFHRERLSPRILDRLIAHEDEIYRVLAACPLSACADGAVKIAEN